MARKAAPIPKAFEEARREHRENTEPAPVPDVVPEPKEPVTVTKSYKVSGRRDVMGVKAGESGDLTLTADQERSLIAAGLIEPVESEAAEPVSADETGQSPNEER